MSSRDDSEDPRHHFIDHHAVRARRLDLRIAESQLADQLRVGTGLIRRLESGCTQSRYDLRFITDLADALHTPVAALLADPTAAETAPPEDDSRRAAQAGRTIAAADGPVPIDAVAAANDWTLAQTLTALDNLNRSLQPAGLTVTRSQGCVAINADRTQPTDKTLAVTGAVLARRALPKDQARALLRVIDGHPTGNDPTSSPGIAIHALLKAGIVDRVVPQPDIPGTSRRYGDAARLIVVSDRTRFSLMLDDEMSTTPTA